MSFREKMLSDGMQRNTCGNYMLLSSVEMRGRVRTASVHFKHEL